MKQRKQPTAKQMVFYPILFALLAGFLAGVSFGEAARRSVWDWLWKFGIAFLFLLEAVSQGRNLIRAMENGSSTAPSAR